MGFDLRGPIILCIDRLADLTRALDCEFNKHRPDNLDDEGSRSYHIDDQSPQDRPFLTECGEPPG